MVMRYVTTEKKLIDFKEQLEATEKRERKLKSELQTLIDKTKYDKEESIRLSSEVEAKANKITLEYLIAEQTEKCSILEQHAQNVTSKLEKCEHQLNETLEERNNIHAANKEKDSIIKNLQNSNQTYSSKIADLQFELKELEIIRSKLSDEQTINFKQATCIETLEGQLLDNKLELEKYVKIESSLLTLNQELSRMNADLQNDLAIVNSKVRALAVENERIKNVQSEYESIIRKIENEVNNERKQRIEERLVMIKHVAGITNENGKLKTRLNQYIGDLDSIKKKHFFRIKDLQREVSSLRKSWIDQINHTAKTVQNSINDNDSMNTVTCCVCKMMCNENESITVKLIDNVLNLEEVNCRQAEKIDFLESFSSAVVGELEGNMKLLNILISRFRNYSGLNTSIEMFNSCTEILDSATETGNVPSNAIFNTTPKSG
ncbi:myosin heavy chain, non-muscle-like isoform X2 [Uranotaenia lowii]|nr:myosin heavy chain, non-muscle-like isoform X2 [Uranotaenia lowii]